MKKLVLFFSLLLCSLAIVAQPQTTGQAINETMNSSGKIYVVVSTLVVVFAGIVIYLFSIDRRLKKIEKEK